MNDESRDSESIYSRLQSGQGAVGWDGPPAQQQGADDGPDPDATQDESEWQEAIETEEEEPVEVGVSTVDRAIQWLIGKGVIYQQTHPQHYNAIVQNRADVESVIHRLGFTLDVDQDHGMVAQRLPTRASEESASPHPMVRRQSLNFFDSLVAIVLREYYRDRERVGDAEIVIDLETLENHVEPFLPLMGSDTQLTKKVNGSVERFTKFQILESKRGQKGFFRITPVILLVMDAQWMHELRKEYESLLRQHTGESEDPAGTADEADDDE